MKERGFSFAHPGVRRPSYCVGGPVGKSASGNPDRRSQLWCPTQQHPECRRPGSGHTVSHNLPPAALLAVGAGGQLPAPPSRAIVLQGWGSCLASDSAADRGGHFPLLAVYSRTKVLQLPLLPSPAWRLFRWFQPWVALLGKPGCHIHPCSAHQSEGLQRPIMLGICVSPQSDTPSSRKYGLIW